MGGKICGWELFKSKVGKGMWNPIKVAYNHLQKKSLYIECIYIKLNKRNKKKEMGRRGEWNAMREI